MIWFASIDRPWPWGHGAPQQRKDSVPVREFFLHLHIYGPAQKKQHTRDCALTRWIIYRMRGFYHQIWVFLKILAAKSGTKFTKRVPWSGRQQLRTNSYGPEKKCVWTFGRTNSCLYWHKLSRILNHPCVQGSAGLDWVRFDEVLVRWVKNSLMI